MSLSKSMALLGLTVALTLVPGIVQAETITNGTVSVGIATINTTFFPGFGNLYDSDIGIGFARQSPPASSFLDPIAPGSPREAWGVSAGLVSGFSDPFSSGNNNLTPNGAPIIGLSTAFVSTFLDAGGGPILRIDQAFSFVAANVLQIAHSVTNVSGAPQLVRFLRNVDLDIAPTPFSEFTVAPAPAGPILDATFGGFEFPNPLFGFLNSVGGGGVFGPGDFGLGILINLGVLGVGATSSFNILYGISLDDQSRPDLAAQLAGLGATYVMTGSSSDNFPSPNGENSFAMGFFIPGQAVIPEPATVILLGIGGVGLAGLGRRLRRHA